MTAGTNQLDIVDQFDDSVLFAFNDVDGTSNPNGVRTNMMLRSAFELLPPEAELSTFDTDVIGGRITALRERLTRSGFRLRMRAPVGGTFADIASAVGVLSHLLASGGVMRWTRDDGVRYIDYEPSPRPVVFSGVEMELIFALDRADLFNGVDVAFWRQPALREPMRDGETNVLTNASLLADLDANGRPDGWTWTSTANIVSETYEQDDYAYRFTTQTASVRSLRQTTGPASAASGQSWTFSFDAAAVTTNVVQARAVIEFLNASSTLIGSEVTGPTVTLTSAFQRVAVTATAPATTDRIRVSLRAVGIGADNRTYLWRRAMLARAGTAYIDGPVTVAADPVAANGRSFPLFVDSDLPVPVELNAEVQGSAATSRLVVSALPDIAGTLPDYLTYTKWAGAVTARGWTSTLTNDTTSVTDADSSENVASTSFATAPTELRKRLRLTRTTRLDSLRGDCDVWIRVRTTAVAEIGLQLRWAPSTLATASHVEPEITHSVESGTTTFGFVDLFLGTIRVPSEREVTLAGIALEVWSRRISGTGAARVAGLWLVPTGASVLSVAGAGEFSVAGESMVAPATIGGDPPLTFAPLGTWGGTRPLDQLNEGAAMPPAGGGPLPSGLSMFEFHHTLSSFVGTVAIRIIDLTADAVVAATGFGFPSSAPATAERHTVIQTQSIGGHSYQAQTYLSAYTSGVVLVRTITHSYTAAIVANETIHTDPARHAAEHLDVNGALADTMRVRGALPFILDPGQYVVAITPQGLPLEGYTDPASESSDTIRVWARYAPGRLV